MRFVLHSASILLAALSASADPSVDGLEVKAVTKPGTTKAVGALCVDSKGRIITNEVNRFRHGVMDNRNFLPWVLTDLTNDRVEQRLDMYEKFENIFPRKQWTEVADTVRVLVEQPDGFFTDGGVLGDFNAPLDGPGIGILERDGYYYYTCIPELWKIADTNYDGKPESRESISHGWGVAVGISGHDMHSPIWGPDGKIYFSIGDRGYNVKTKEGTTLFSRSRGACLRINPDGSGLEKVCTGLRNPQEIAFNDTFDLVTADNNGDIGDNSRAYYIIEGGDYGWVEGWQVLTTFGKHLLGDERIPPAWMTEKLYFTPHAEQPWWVVPASGFVTSGPSGLVYASTDALGADTKGSFLVCDFVANAARSGVRRFKMVPKGAGYEMTGGDMWLKGCCTPDITLDHADNLIVGDFGEGWEATANGGVWKVLAKNPQTHSVELFKKGFRNLNLTELATELSSVDIKIRVEAQAELVRRGAKAELLKVAQSAGNDGSALFGRLHGIRALGQLDAVSDLRSFVKDAHAEIRTQALRALADAKSSVTADFVPSLEDAEIRVRQAAALGCARKPNAGVSAALVKRFNSADVQDPWMRPSLAHALACQSDFLAFKASMADANARRLYVVALRKARSPELASFLADADSNIVAEALAAISFENIETAIPALAEFSATPACWKLSEVNVARALNANMRLNNKAGAGRLLDVLANKDAPQSARRMAGLLLRGFIKPWQMDFVEGKKLDWDSGKAPLAEDAKELLASRLGGILSSADGDALTAALKLAELAGFKADEATLLTIALNTKANEAARIEAIHSLGAKLALADLTTLTKEGSSAIRVAAIKGLVASQPAAALPALLAGRSAQGLDERQVAWQGLGVLSAPEAVAALKEGLASVNAGKNEEVALDIYLAAKKQATLANEVKALEDKLNAGPAGVWILAAKGGNAERGEKVFISPPSACECLKCHKVGKKGASDAGPNLKGFLGHIDAKASNADYSLLATVAPTADLAPKFGFVSLVLNDGSNVTGVFLSEDAKGLKLKVGTEDKTFDLASIKTRSNISPMPPLKALVDSGIMKPEDLRDLTQYLVKIGSDKSKDGH